jgi:hypothetical protein
MNRLLYLPFGLLLSCLLHLQSQPKTFSDAGFIIQTKKIDTDTNFIKGRITRAVTGTPVCYADICTSTQTSVAKSNPEGDFSLGPVRFPVTLRISKFGYEDITVTIRNSADKTDFSLVPLEFHKSYSGKRKLLQYDLIFRRALEKIRNGMASTAGNDSRREMVYSRIAISKDTAVTSFFESYSEMETGITGFRSCHPLLSRYASSDEFIPGLTGNDPEFTTERFFSMPILPERYITRKGYFVMDGKQVAIVKVDLDYMVNTFFISVPDTSVIFINSLLKAPKKINIPGPEKMQKIKAITSAEIAFSYDDALSTYFVSWAGISEEYLLESRNKNAQKINRRTLHALVPDSSGFRSSVRDKVAHSQLNEMKKQINFSLSFRPSVNTTAFDSEKERLLVMPYFKKFWSGNTYIMPLQNEKMQLSEWENKNSFYSEDRLPEVPKAVNADSLTSILNSKIVAVENIYAETDRKEYLAGDTIWFSAYVLDNLHMDSSSVSKIMYADLINSDNKVEKHLKLLITNSRTHGDFVIKSTAKNGICRLRFYTQYMRNFQEDYLFEKEIAVHQSDFKTMFLVNPLIKKCLEGDSVELHLRTILPEEYDEQEKELQVIARLNDTLNVSRTFSFKRILDEAMGFFVPVSLNCPFTDIRLILTAKSGITEQRLSVPLRSGINISFFPESGKLIGGIKTVVAYKATDSKGNPTAFAGDISDGGKVLFHIKGDSLGVGKFELEPETGKTYSAVIGLSGNKYSFTLPQVEPKGYILNFDADSGLLTLKNNCLNTSERHYLMLSVRGAVYSTSEIRTGSNALSIRLPFRNFPKGIIQVTLFDSLFRPLAERLVFNNRTDRKMILKIEPDKKEYKPREKVNLNLSVSDVYGNPVKSELTVSVTDASREDTSQSVPDIESYLFLASELKGTVDYRLINLSDTSREGNRKRDLVLMTQGWRNYLWNSIRYKSIFRILYPLERGFRINGYVYNAGRSKSCFGYKLNYFDLKSAFNGVAEIDADNKFKIDIPLHYNFRDYFIQNSNVRGRIGNLGFVLDTFDLPKVSLRNNALPFYLNRSGYLAGIDREFSKSDSLGSLNIKYHNLPEVKVTAKSDRTGYTSPTKTVNLEKGDPTGKKYASLFQMIYAEFGEKAFTADGFGTEKTVFNPILVINGAPLTAAECPPCYDYTAYSWAADIPPNEISEIKLYEAGSKYSQWLSPPPRGQAWSANGMYILAADPKLYLPVVSVKTYGDTYRGNPKGAILLTYQGLYMAREFYKPDYEKKNPPVSDNRTTLYWNPEIQTDSTGSAKITFFNSDLKGKALIKVSGVSYSLKDAASRTVFYISH